MTRWGEQPEERRTALTETLTSQRGRRYPDHADGSAGFAAWLLVADRACLRSLGVSIFDLSDWAWRDAYDAGGRPGAAVREAVAAADTFGMLLGGAG